MNRQYWITVEEYGTVYSTTDQAKAEDKFSLWCRVLEDAPGETKEVTLFADLADGEGSVIWKRY